LFGFSAPSPFAVSSPVSSVLALDLSAAPDGGFRSEPDSTLPLDPPCDAASRPDKAVRDDALPVVEDALPVVEGDLLFDDESLVDDAELDGSAYATPGVLAMAAPTPRVTANAPTRPMYLA
jgi:hypothetical protein